VTPSLGKSVQQQIRQSHIGSAALFVPPSTKLTFLPFAPVSNPSRRQPTSLQKAKSIQVQGPLGIVLVPLADYVELNWEDQPESSTSTDPRKLSLSVKDSSVKTQRSTWGLTRALLSNAIEGVEEGHNVVLRLVGVGYRATIETDPFPRPDKFQVALTSTPTNFETKEQMKYYSEWTSEQAKLVGTEKKRLALRLGYSHPIYLPVPRGITCTTPAPTRIVIKGTDKEQVGLFASQIRRWRKPEPYKGKGVFVGDETIKLKTPKKK
jgi:large subunit ribosomal protein L6